MSISYSEYLPQRRKGRQVSEKSNLFSLRASRPFDLAQDMLGAMIILFLGDLARTAIASQTVCCSHELVQDVQTV
jgi:hypothetical protein